MVLLLAKEGDKVLFRRSIVLYVKRKSKPKFDIARICRKISGKHKIVYVKLPDIVNFAYVGNNFFRNSLHNKPPKIKRPSAATLDQRQIINL